MTLSDLVARARREDKSLTFAYPDDKGTFYARVVLPNYVEDGLLWAECLSARDLRTFSVDKIERPRLGWAANDLEIPVPKLEIVYKSEAD